MNTPPIQQQSKLQARVARTYEVIMRAIFEEEKNDASWILLAAGAFLVVMIACLVAFFL